MPVAEVEAGIVDGTLGALHEVGHGVSSSQRFRTRGPRLLLRRPRLVPPCQDQIVHLGELHLK